MSVGSLSGDHRRLAGVIDSGRARARGDPAAATVTVALGLLTVLAAVLRFTRLAHQGFWFDEANTAADVHFSPGKMLGLLPQNETTPPLFYCVAWVWARVFGFGEFALRSLPALAGVARVPGDVRRDREARQPARGRRRRGADRLQPVPGLVLAGVPALQADGAAERGQPARLRLRPRAP